MGENEEPEKDPRIKRFELMLKKNGSWYFDSEDFEFIIDYYIDENNAANALAAISAALEQHPYSGNFKIRKAQILLALNRTKQALELLEEIEVLEPENPEIHATRGAIYSFLKKPDLAILSYKKALKHSDRRDDLFLNIAHEHVNQGNYEKAVDAIQKSLEENPDNDFALFELGFCFDLLDMTEESTRFYLQFIDEHPYSEAAWYNLGNCYNKSGLYEKAIEAFDYAIVIKDDFTGAKFNKANAYSRLGEYQKAIEIYREMLDQEESDGLVYFYIGECYEQMDRNESALAFYHKAVKKDPTLAEAWMRIGLLMNDSGRLTEGIHYVKKAIELNPESGEYWMLFADIEQDLGFFDESENAYKKALELDPTLEEAWLNYSELLFENQAETEAKEIILTGIKTLPDSSHLFYRLAAYEFEMGNNQSGMETLETALQMDYENHKDLLEEYPELKENVRVMNLIELYKK